MLTGLVGVTIRPASEQDEAALRALDQAIWSWDVTPAPSPPSDKRFFSRESGPDDVLVAMIDGAVAGYVKLARALPWNPTATSSRSGAWRSTPPGTGAVSVAF